MTYNRLTITCYSEHVARLIFDQINKHATRPDTAAYGFLYRRTDGKVVTWSPIGRDAADDLEDFIQAEILDPLYHEYVLEQI